MSEGSASSPRKMSMKVGNKGKGESRELRFGNKVKLEETGERTVINSINMAGQKKRSQWTPSQERGASGHHT